MNSNIKILSLIVSVVGLTSCMPSDAYKMRYDQQDISYSLTTPLSEKESEKLVTPVAIKKQEGHQDVKRPPFERKKVADTKVFFDKEDNEQFFNKEEKS